MKTFDELKLADGVPVIAAGRKLYRVHDDDVLELYPWGVAYPPGDGDPYVFCNVAIGMADRAISVGLLYATRSAALAAIATRMEQLAIGARRRAQLAVQEEEKREKSGGGRP